MSSEFVYEGKFRGCILYVTRDDGLLHLSISRKDRLPSYDELKAARYQFMADVPYVAQLFPPQEDFVNVHEHCLHLWELSPREHVLRGDMNE
jgi:hypothetical protein